MPARKIVTDDPSGPNFSRAIARKLELLVAGSAGTSDAPLLARTGWRNPLDITIDGEATMVFVYVLVAILGVGAVVFTIQNPQPVAVTFLQWRTVELPLSLVMLLSAFVGLLFASISGFAQQIQLQRRIRRLEDRLAELSRAATSRLRPSPTGLSSVRQSPSPTLIRGGHSVNAIQFLKQEHQKAKAAFEKVLHAPPQERGQLWKELAPELEFHEQVEDVCLYEPLSRDAAQSDRELATWRRRHQQEVDKVGSLIEATRGLPPDEAAWLSKVQEIHSSLETHIQEEEEDIFPRVGSVWDESRLERAEAQMRDMMSKRLGRRVA